MTDLSKTIIAKSDQLNSDDLIGAPITIKVTSVNLLAGDQPVSIGYEGDNGKPWKPCKSMRRVLVGVWGPDGNQYKGRSLTLYRDPNVSFGGQQTGGIRISHMSHIETPITMALTASRNNKKPFTVKPLNILPTASQAVDEEKLLIAATEMAKGGTVKLQEYWNTLTAAEKLALKPYMDRLKSSAAAVNAIVEDDPFGLPPIPDQGGGESVTAG